MTPEWLLAHDDVKFERILLRLARLRSIGVAEVIEDSSVIRLLPWGEAPFLRPNQFESPINQTQTSSIPAQTGTTTAVETRDIFDVLESGVIPGSPSPDGLTSDPGTG